MKIKAVGSVNQNSGKLRLGWRFQRDDRRHRSGIDARDASAISETEKGSSSGIYICGIEFYKAVLEDHVEHGRNSSNGANPILWEGIMYRRPKTF